MAGGWNTPLPVLAVAAAIVLTVWAVARALIWIGERLILGRSADEAEEEGAPPFLSPGWLKRYREREGE